MFAYKPDGLDGRAAIKNFDLRDRIVTICDAVAFELSDVDNARWDCFAMVPEECDKVFQVVSAPVFDRKLTQKSFQQLFNRLLDVEAKRPIRNAGSFKTISSSAALISSTSVPYRCLAS